jgi:hypothetical protein
VPHASAGASPSLPSPPSQAAADPIGAPSPRDWSSSDLHGASLLELSMPGAVLDYSLATQVDARGVRMPDSSWRAADLSGADLSAADLSGADLTGAKLAKVTGRNARFAHAQMRGTDLTGADLTGADLTGADLAGADLSGTDLTGARVGGADLALVTYSSATTFPEGTELPLSALRYDPPAIDLVAEEWRSDDEVALVSSVEAVAKLHRSLTPLTRRSLAAASARRPMANLAEIEGVQGKLAAHAAAARSAWAKLRQG